MRQFIYVLINFTDLPPTAKVVTTTTKATTTTTKKPVPPPTPAVRALKEGYDYPVPAVRFDDQLKKAPEVTYL